MEQHERLTSMRLRLLNDRVSRRAAWDIARAKGWDSLRDAEYLAIARLQADALVTIDEHLAEAARGVVPVASLNELQRPAAEHPQGGLQSVTTSDRRRRWRWGH